MAFDRKTLIEFPVSTFGQVVGFAVLTAIVVIAVVPMVNKFLKK